jgi:predicted nucleic acid-binding protein
MSDKVFCDTNVFVYAALQSPGCEEKREAAIAVLTGDSPIVASTQVLNEFSAVLLRNRVSDADVQSRVENIIADCSMALVTVETIRLAWEVKKRYLLSYWDSLIVASALRAGCHILFTEDLSDGMLIENSLRIVNPFV